MRLDADATTALRDLVATRHRTGQRVTATADLLAALQDAVDAHARLPLLEEVLRTAQLYLREHDLAVTRRMGRDLTPIPGRLDGIDLWELRRAVDEARPAPRPLPGSVPLFTDAEFGT